MQNNASTPPTKKLKQAITYFLLAGLIFCAAGCIFSWFGIINNKNRLVHRAQEKCFESFEQIGTTLQSFINKMQHSMDQWSSGIQDGSYAAHEHTEKLFYLLQPYANTLNVINTSKQSGYTLSLDKTQKVHRKDYSQKEFIEKQWYQDVLKTHKPVWKVDVQEKANINTTLAHPFFEQAVFAYPLQNDSEGSSVGTVIALTIPFAILEYIMRSVGVESTDTIMLFSDENKLMFHSDTKMLTSVKTVTDHAFNALGSWWKEFTFQINTQHYIQRILQNTLFEPISILNYQRLPETSWKLCFVYKDSGRLIDHGECYNFLKYFLFLCAMALSFLLALIAILTLRYSSITYICSIASSITFVLLIGYLWKLQDKPYMNTQDRINIVQDSFQAKQFLNILQIKRHGNLVAHHAGIYIFHVHEMRPTEFEIGCMLWKAFDKEPKDKDKKFPFILDSSWKYQIAEPLIRKTEDGWAVGWAAAVTLKTQYEYNRYPFDMQEIRLSFLLADAKESAILPDFAGGKIFGYENEQVGKHIKLSHWNLKTPYYVYQTHKKGPAFECELNFVLPLQRKPESILIGILLPIFLTLCILFAMLIHCGRSLASGKDATGQPLMPYISFSGAAILTNIIPHTNLRLLLAGMSSYAETFYYIAYVCVILALINCIIAHKPGAPFFIQYNNNIIARVCFWPITFLIITLMVLICF